MLTLENFASLSQLGAGVGLALAVFVEPLRFRELSLLKRLEGDLKTIANQRNARGRREKNLILSEKLCVLSAGQLLRRKEVIPMRFLAAGAVSNFVILLASTLAPSTPISEGWALITLVASLGPFLAGAVWIAMLKAEHLDSIAAHYRGERAKLHDEDAEVSTGSSGA